MSNTEEIDRANESWKEAIASNPLRQWNYRDGYNACLEELTKCPLEEWECKKIQRRQDKEIAELKRRLKIAVEALGFECGNRCAHQNPCNAREALASIGGEGETVDINDTRGSVSK